MNKRKPEAEIKEQEPSEVTTDISQPILVKQNDDVLSITNPPIAWKSQSIVPIYTNGALSNFMYLLKLGQD